MLRLVDTSGILDRWEFNPFTGLLPMGEASIVIAGLAIFEALIGVSTYQSGVPVGGAVWSWHAITSCTLPEGNLGLHQLVPHPHVDLIVGIRTPLAGIVEIMAGGRPVILPLETGPAMRASYLAPGLGHQHGTVRILFVPFVDLPGGKAEFSYVYHVGALGFEPRFLILKGCCHGR